MEGNMLYLLFRQDLQSGGIVLESPHATFDGVAEKMDTLSDYWKEKGRIIKDNKCDLIVAAADGSPLWYYFVSSRTILK